MSQDNQFQQYGYDHYLKAPPKGAGGVRLKPQPPGFAERLKGRFENPLFATAVLLVAGAVFAGVLIMAYPSDDADTAAVPIVTADLRPVKVQPEARGGMEVPYRDSTVLADIGSSSSYSNQDGVENLLAPSPPVDLASKEEAFSAAVDDVRPDDVGAENLLQKIDSPEGLAAAMPEPGAESEVEPVVDVKAAQVIPPSSVEEAQDAAVQAQSSVDNRPRSLHAAATSPETIDFVKSVMDKNNVPEAPVAAPAPIAVPSPSASAEALNQVSPAAGAASPSTARAVSGGGYYVQLASITARDRADGEWKKLQASYSSQLGGADYRVQEANLSGKGTFYRIQAGPFSKDDANSICAAIKAQKPGGCLVVK
ncbi:MAG: SPOR domain-containing protein [Alphaproteobacteria bacterium]|nr:SPOR domain-containing protein [Alphaproteobacteria bacterium]